MTAARPLPVAPAPVAGAHPLPAPRAATAPGATPWAALAVAWRNLLAYVRLPELLVFSTIQPVMFVLLFRYVFGNSIALSDPSMRTSAT